MKDKIDYFLEILTTLTKEEADLIAQVLKWDDEHKIAFFLAKQFFDEKES